MQTMRLSIFLAAIPLLISCGDDQGEPAETTTAPDDREEEETQERRAAPRLFESSGPTPHIAPTLEYVPGPEGTDAAEVREAIRAVLERARGTEPISVGAESVSAGPVLLRFYEARDFLPAFHDGARPRSSAMDAVIEAVSRAREHGLRPEDYHHEELRGSRRRPPSEPEAIAALDILASDAFVTLSTHLLKGKVDPVTIHPTWTAQHRAGDVLELFRRGLTDERLAEALTVSAPRDDGYARLQSALTRYRALAERELPDVGAAPFQPTPERNEVIRLHLEARGDLTDRDLPAAIRRFQSRHGLSETGEVDAATLDAFRVPLSDRVETLRVNLERWRWLPEDLGERQIRVNIAGFSMRYLEEGEVRLQMRAIVGKTYRKTPIFSDLVRYVVLNPTWTVPSTVFREDLLPEVRRDRRILERRGLEVLTPEGRPVDPTTIQWRGVRHGDVYLRQPAGPNNALGPVKFMFPNAYDVYLHGTPRQDLFEEAERAFSSGCIRLERPLELAELLLRDQRGFGAEELRAIVATRQTRTVHLTHPIPVHLLYSTAWVEPDGAVHFRRDIYERDDAVEEALGTDRPAPLAHVAGGPAASAG